MCGERAPADDPIEQGLDQPFGLGAGGAGVAASGEGAGAGAAAPSDLASGAGSMPFFTKATAPSFSSFSLLLRAWRG